MTVTFPIVRKTNAESNEITLMYEATFGREGDIYILDRVEGTTFRATTPARLLQQLLWFLLNIPFGGGGGSQPMSVMAQDEMAVAFSSGQATGTGIGIVEQQNRPILEDYIVPYEVQNATQLRELLLILDCAKHTIIKLQPNTTINVDAPPNDPAYYLSNGSNVGYSGFPIIRCPVTIEGKNTNLFRADLSTKYRFFTVESIVANQWRYDPRQGT